MTDVPECVADKGYKGNAFAGGRHRNESNTEDVTFVYRPVETGKQMRGSTKPENISACAGREDAYVQICRYHRFFCGR